MEGTTLHKHGEDATKPYIMLYLYDVPIMQLLVRYGVTNVLSHSGQKS